MTTSLPVSLTVPAAAGARSDSKTVRKRNKKKKKSSDRQMAAFAATTTVTGSRVPILRSIGGGDARIRVSHREYLCDILGATNYTVGKVLSINPALPETFPWLSQMAKLYETYQFRSLRFEFHTSVGTATVGNVMMAVDYDAFDSAPTTKSEFLMQHSCVRTSAWCDAAVVCDPRDLAKFGTQRYTRQAGLASNLDIKTYDVGRLFVATSGMVPGTVGELHVSYEIDLMTPQPPNWDDWGAEKIQAAQNAKLTALTPLGDPGLATVVGDLGVEVADEATLLFRRAGSYFLNSTIGGSSLTGTGGPTLSQSYPPGAVTFNTIASAIIDGGNTGVNFQRVDVGADGAKARFSLPASTVVGAVYRFSPGSVVAS